MSDTSLDTDALTAHIERLEAQLARWEDYWGCSDPHDTHVAAGTSDKFARQLGTEQARANRLEAQLAVAEEALEKIRSYMPSSDPAGYSYGAGKDRAWRITGAISTKALADLPEAASDIKRSYELIQHLEAWRAKDGHVFDLTNPEHTVQPVLDKNEGLLRDRARLDKIEKWLLTSRGKQWERIAIDEGCIFACDADWEEIPYLSKEWLGKTLREVVDKLTEEAKEGEETR